MWIWKGPWSMCGVLESGITLPMTVSHYIPLLPGRGFSSTCSRPWLFGPSPVSPSLLWPPSTAIPSPPCVRTGRGVGKAVVRCARQQPHCRHGGCHPVSGWERLSPARSSRDSAGQSPSPTPLHALCGSWCGRPQSQGLSICLWFRQQAQEKGRCLAQLPHPKQRLDYCFSGWGRRSLAVGGRLSCRTGSPGTYGPALDLLVSPCPRERHSQQNPNILASRETAEKGKKLVNVKGTISYFWTKISRLLFCPRSCKLCSQSYK